MKNVIEMSKDEIVHWADKTIKSIDNAVARGRKADGCPGLNIRYEAIKDIMKECGQWDEFCEYAQIDSDMDFEDFFE